MGRVKKLLKSLKKRKNIHEDFVRRKKKVGKKLQPINATPTKFVYKSVYVAQQLGDVKEGESVNIRKQTLSDLLSLLTHPNVKKRRDAILGTRDLFQKNEGLVRLTLCSWIRLLSLMQDCEGIVRKALKAFTEYAFKRCQKGELSPFLPVVISYFTAALSHYSSRVKMDALVVLRTYLRLQMPSPKVYHLKLLPHFKIILEDLTSFRYRPTSSQFSRKKNTLGKRFSDTVPLLDSIIEVLTRISELNKAPIGTPLKSSSSWCPTIPQSDYARALYTTSLGGTFDVEEEKKLTATYVLNSADPLTKLFVEATSEVSNITKYLPFALKLIAVLQVGVEFLSGEELEKFYKILKRMIFNRGPWRNQLELSTASAKLMASLGRTHPNWIKFCKSIA